MKISPQVGTALLEKAVDEFNDSSISASLIFEIDKDGYKLFQLKGTSYRFAKACVITASVLFVYYSITSFWSSAGYVLHIARHCRTLLIPLMFKYLENISKAQKGAFDARSTISARHLGNVIIILLNIIMSVLLLSSIFANMCLHGSIVQLPSVFTCVYRRPDFPYVPFMATLLTTFGCPLMFRAHDALINVGSCVVTVLSLIITMIFSNSELKISFFFYLACILIVVVNYELVHYRVKVYNSFCVLKVALQQMATVKTEKDDILKQSSTLRHIIGTVAHDLKTPVQAFMSELSTMESSLTTKQKDSLEMLYSICHFMTMTINRSLDYAKIDSGIALVPSMQTISIPESITWVLRCIDGSVIEGVSINTKELPSAIIPLIITDKQWLLENLLCLMSNSVKFVSQGSITIGVELVVEPTKSLKSLEFLRFEVEDTGIGIPDDKKLTLFQPFVQAQSRAGGTGLGLYAMRKRVETLGGSCGICNRRDGAPGSLFYFTIPYRPDTTSTITLPIDRATSALSSAATATTATTTTGSKLDSRTSALEGLNILIVDDSFIIQKTVLRALVSVGAKCEVAGNGVVCLEKLSKISFDIVLLDINMPIMDGIECITRLRALEATPTSARHFKTHQLVIGLSANSDSESREEALRAGMDGYATKPLSIDHLEQICTPLLLSPV